MILIPNRMSSDTYYDSVDITLGAISIICFLVGLPGNLLALVFFLRMKKSIPTCIYIFITANDILTALCIFPVSLTFLNQRNQIMFQYKTFCDLWGVANVDIFNCST